MRSTILLVTGIAALLALGACNGGPSEVVVAPTELPLPEGALENGVMTRRVGVLRHYGDSLLFEAPSRAAVGVPIEVHVTTYGGGCLGQDTTVTNVNGLRATVVPYQRAPVDPNVACTMELVLQRRLVRVTFQSAGLATLRVIGRDEPASRLFAVERRIEVR